MYSLLTSTFEKQRVDLNNATTDLYGNFSTAIGAQ